MYTPQSKKSHDSPYRFQCRSCREMKKLDQYGRNQLSLGIQRCMKCVFDYNRKSKQQKRDMEKVEEGGAIQTQEEREECGFAPEGVAVFFPKG
jgi:hypothetical protein